MYSLREGLPPEVNLSNEKNNGEIIIKLIENNLINTIHDVSSGGIIIALAEMSLSSLIGIKINKPKKLSNVFEFFFGEDQSRYIIEVQENNYEKVEKILKENNIFFENIGITQNDFFELEKELRINVKELYELNNKWYNNYNAIKS